MSLDLSIYAVKQDIQSEVEVELDEDAIQFSIASWRNSDRLYEWFNELYKSKGGEESLIDSWGYLKLNEEDILALRQEFETNIVALDKLSLVCIFGRGEYDIPKTLMILKRAIPAMLQALHDGYTIVCSAS